MSRGRRGKRGSVGQQLQSAIEATLSPTSRRKEGPREVGRSKVKLASERAGIKPMTANQSRKDAQTGFEWAGKKNSFMMNNASAWKMPPKVTNVDTDAWARKAAGDQTAASEAELRKVFEEVDLDNSNTIELDEFIHAFGNLPGLQLDEPQLVKLFRKVDTDKSGGIDFDEFKIAYKQMDIVKSFMQQQMKAAGLSTRKAGPRELRKGKGRVRLASERAGIRPAHCMDNVQNPKDFLRPRHNSTGGGWGMAGRGVSTRARSHSAHTRPAGVNRSGLAPTRPAPAAVARPGYNSGSRRNSTRRSRTPNRRNASPGIMARFTGAAQQQEKPELDEDAMKVAFDRVDVDGSGTIELDEFIAALKSMNIGYDVHQATQLFKEVDTDGSGGIDFEEFKASYDKIDVVQAFIEQQCKAAGLSTRKVGPRELGRASNLTSQKAGIRSMTASDAASKARPDFWNKPVPKAALKGFSATKLSTYANQDGDPTTPVKKLGPRELSHWKGDRVGILWSVTMGIKPMTARRAVAIAKQGQYLGKNRATAASLQGFSTVRRTPETYQRGSSRRSRSLGGMIGPRYNPRNNAKISPATAMIRDHLMGVGGPPQSRGRARASSASPSRLGYGNSGRGISAIQRKQGPRETGRNRVKLASEKAGIRPMTARMAQQNAVAGMTSGWSGKKNNALSFQNPNAFHVAKRSGDVNSGTWFQQNSVSNEKKDMQQLREAFDRVDLDSSNSIEMDEFTSALKFLGAEMDVFQMESLFQELDKDGNGCLDFDEFSNGYDRIDVMKTFIERSLKSAGLSTRKAGPREIGRSKKLASELAGIKPMKASEIIADPNFTAPKVTRASLQGFGVKPRNNGAGAKKRSNNRTRSGSIGRRR